MNGSCAAMRHHAWFTLTYRLSLVYNHPSDVCGWYTGAGLSPRLPLVNAAQIGFLADDIREGLTATFGWSPGAAWFPSLHTLGLHRVREIYSIVA